MMMMLKIYRCCCKLFSMWLCSMSWRLFQVSKHWPMLTANLQMWRSW